MLRSDIEYIATIPYSSNIEAVDGRLHPVLSVLSKMAVDASIIVWQHQPAAHVVQVGETCYPGFSTTAELMRLRATRLLGSQSHPGKLALLDSCNGRTLDNTALQMWALAKYLHKKPAGPSLAVGLGYHADRVLTHAGGNDLHMDYVAAEDVLRLVGATGYDPYVEHLAKLEPSERVLRALSRLNPTGSLFKQAAKVTGPRVVDLKKTPAGKITLVNTTAKRRLAQEAAKIYRY